MTDLCPVPVERHWRLGVTWEFKGIRYQANGPYTDDEFRLLIIEEFDKERKLFERLKQKHDQVSEFRSSLHATSHTRKCSY